jgi:hypothetical protein
MKTHPEKLTGLKGRHQNKGRVSAKRLEEVTGGSIAHSTTEPQPRSNEQRFFRFAGARPKAAGAVVRPGGKGMSAASHAANLIAGGRFQGG